MNDVIKQIDGFYKNRYYYIETDSLHLHKKYWSDLIDNGFIGKSLGLGKNDYGNPGKFHAWFLGPKMNCLLEKDHFGVISGKRTFKGYSEEHKMIKLDEYISLSERKIVSGGFLIDWTK